MLHVDATLFSAALACLAFSLALLGSLSLLGWLRRRRDGNAIGELIAAVGDRDGDSLAAFRQLALALGASEQDADEHAGALQRQRKTMLKEIIRVYAERDASGFAGILEQVDAQLDPVRSLADAGRAALDSEPSAPETAREVAEMKAHNDRLTQELEITRQTMNNMLSEYAQMYERGERIAPPPSATAARLVTEGGGATEMPDDAQGRSVDPSAQAADPGPPADIAAEAEALSVEIEPGIADSAPEESTGEGTDRTAA